MVDRLRPTDRVPTVSTPTRIRPAQRERHRQDRRGAQSEEGHHEQSAEGQEATKPEGNTSTPRDWSAYQRRYLVPIHKWHLSARTGVRARLKSSTVIDYACGLKSTAALAGTKI